MPQFVPSAKRLRRLAIASAAICVMLLACWPNPLQAHCSGLPRAQKHESRHEIDQLEMQWRDAVLKGDTGVMNSLLADDYMAVTPFGTLQTRDEALASLSSRSWHVDSLNLYDRKVRFYGTTAIVTSIADVQGISPEGNISGSYRYTRVYARNLQGDWKIVSFEASRIGEPAENADRK